MCIEIIGQKKIYDQFIPIYLINNLILLKKYNDLFYAIFRLYEMIS